MYVQEIWKTIVAHHYGYSLEYMYSIEEKNYLSKTIEKISAV